MRYYLEDNGGWLSVSGDAEMFATIPPGYREVTEAEYNEAAGVITLPAPEPNEGDRVAS
ncbi:hypothetical protein [Streptomyces sp. SAI-127]|uniref:hypothetical protein n=1 Tax=Streptomyces sp. SAI-127 TaxID=2940543 RepID=UPI0024769761|nr:hypothetical protein [Streptomyces sp. SAI-127]MDH6489672.1 hypothetical protein [Streptomyces sp. SAI-127]